MPGAGATCLAIGSKIANRLKLFLRSSPLFAVVFTGVGRLHINDRFFTTRHGCFFLPPDKRLALWHMIWQWLLIARKIFKVQLDCLRSRTKQHFRRDFVMVSKCAIFSFWQVLATECVYIKYHNNTMTFFLCFVTFDIRNGKSFVTYCCVFLSYTEHFLTHTP